MSDVSGKVCLITGAAGGLGKVIAEAFILAKAKTVIVDIDPERLRTTEKELSVHGDVLALNVDVTNEDAVKGMVLSTLERFGKLDALINNAARPDLFDGVATLEKSLWDKVIALNLTGPYLTCKYAVEHFLSRDPTGGVIVNIASIGGMRGGAAYIASKHGVIGLTRNTAVWYGKQGVRCNAVMPSSMMTLAKELYMTSNVNEAGKAISMSTNALDVGFIDQKKVAATVRFLCSDDAGAINGTTVATDNGYLAK
ncbi:short-chain dehydrogenase/reductase SDR [Venturia nashicola]|uniref:Short-chain dehydrogenase/reductase SDR n=1 Tax=Venturia nashicola TaxID=86259 RepID=A0A4Z1PH02_9PEZI|nr:short-chain dehydrogenase/reductase SDR [Venturia nashicola]